VSTLTIGDLSEVDCLELKGSLRFTEVRRKRSAVTLQYALCRGDEANGAGNTASAS
jgi:hypothetical protein